NGSNDELAIQLAAADNSGALEFRLDPPGVVVSKSASAIGTLHARVRERRFWGKVVDRPFTVSARGSDDPGGQPLATTSGILADAARVPFLPLLFGGGRRAALLALPLLAALALLAWLLGTSGTQAPFAPPIATPTVVAAAASPTLPAPPSAGAS